MRAPAAFALLGPLGLLAGLTAGTAPATATVGFGAAVFNPAAGASFTVAGLRSLAPVRRSWALHLTRSVDGSSPGLDRAHAGGVHYRTVRLAWSVAGGAASLCLDDVAITAYARRPLPAGPGGGSGSAGGGAVERLTLSYAAATRAVGLGACRRRPAPPPVVVRLHAEAPSVLRARVDCLVARCAGSVRLLCPAAGCPTAGLRLGAVALGAGREATLRARLPRPLGGRHPAVTAAVTLAGRAAPLLVRVVVDAPAPVVVSTLTSSAPSSSTSPPPPGLPPAGGVSVGGAPAGAPGGGGGGGGTGGGTGAGGGAAGGSNGAGAGAGTGGGAGGGLIDTTLGLACDGPAKSFTGVHGVLGPAVAGAPVEIDYVPADAAAPTVIHNVTTGSGGGFSDASGTPFVRAVAFYGGDAGHVDAAGFCP